jgi:hypothetical protein
MFLKQHDVPERALLLALKTFLDVLEGLPIGVRAAAMMCSNKMREPSGEGMCRALIVTE